MHLAALELDLAVLQGEEGVVVADTDVEAGEEPGPALADGVSRRNLSRYRHSAFGTDPEQRKMVQVGAEAVVLQETGA